MSMIEKYIKKPSPFIIPGISKEVDDEDQQAFFWGQTIDGNQTITIDGIIYTITSADYSTTNTFSTDSWTTTSEFPSTTYFNVNTATNNTLTSGYSQIVEPTNRTPIPEFNNFADMEMNGWYLQPGGVYYDIELQCHMVKPFINE